MEPPTVNLHKSIAEFYIGPGAGEHLHKYKAFLKHYQRSTASLSSSSEKSVYQIDQPLLASHEHVQQLVAKLRDEPTTTRRQLENTLRLHAGTDVLEQEMQHAIRTVLRVGFMLDYPSSSSKSSRQNARSQWQPNETFSNFVARELPKADEGISMSYKDIAASSAWRLKAKSGVRIERTDDIADHLLYNPDTRTLKIFHQMAYLRAQLQQSYGMTAGRDKEVFEKPSTLPPQLIIETLESFYRILFPIASDKPGHSKRLLKRLVLLKGFDPQCPVQLDASRWRPEDFQYVYWGSRLQILGEVAGRNITQNKYMAWIERHTTERQALTVAIIGLVFSAVFGFLAVLVTSAQLAIQVVAWKYPVAPP